MHNEPHPALGASQLQHITRTDLQRAEMLEESRWLRGFDWNEVQIFARHLDTYQLNRGEVAFREGSREGFLCVICRGSVSVQKEARGRKPKEITLLGPGKSFGEMALIDGQPRSATVVATDDSTLLVMTRQDYDRLLDSAPRLAARLMQRLASMISSRLRATTGQLVDYLDHAQP